jgi:valyl-tRNA synthetase
VKITPAHDYVDFEVGKRHNLEMISLINENGDLNENCGMFAVSSGASSQHMCKFVRGVA